MDNKLIIFDLDGTLFNSLNDIAYNINAMLNHFSLPTLSTSEIRSRVGNGAKKLVIDCVGTNVSEEQLMKCLEYYNKIYTASPCVYSVVYDGIDIVLQSLKEKGYKLAILSNKPQMTVDPIYQRFFSKYNFDAVIGQSGNIKCKPDKTTTLNLLKNLNVKNQNAIIVGDGETDIITAKNAGINSIAVLWGFRDKIELVNAGATNFANSPEDLLNLIHKIIN